MSRRLILFGLLVGIISSLLLTDISHATTLEMRPLIYRDSLKSGDKKRGFVDISNPSGKTLELRTSVQAFRQISDHGDLEFYDSAKLSSGILIDLDSFTLKPRETLRLYFLIDGTKLPEGDVFAAIFASSYEDRTQGTNLMVRVGTLLVISNATPAKHVAEVDRLEAPFFQVGDSVTASLDIRNTTDTKNANGFYPEIQMLLQPYASKTVTGPLVFAGRTRTIDYRDPGNYFGPMLLQAKSGDSHKSQLIFAVTGYWRWLAPLIFVVITFIGLLFKKRHKKH